VESSTSSIFFLIVTHKTARCFHFRYNFVQCALRTYHAYAPVIPYAYPLK